MSVLTAIEDAYAAWDEVVRRFEASDEPALRGAAESALCWRAQHEVDRRRGKDRSSDFSIVRCFSRGRECRTSDCTAI